MRVIYKLRYIKTPARTTASFIDCLPEEHYTLPRSIVNAAVHHVHSPYTYLLVHVDAPKWVYATVYALTRYIDRNIFVPIRTHTGK